MISKHFVLFCELIKSSIWNTEYIPPNDIDWETVYHFFKSQALISLPNKHLKNIPNDTKAKWKNLVYQDQYRNFMTMRKQKELLQLFLISNIAIIVLKGTSAAQYYLNPQYRTMGDIDFLTLPENYDAACSLLLSVGWMETTSSWDNQRGRHRSFVKEGITTEIHRFFSSYVNEEKGAVLDEILVKDIELGRFTLHDIQNGLVLLEHIAQHLRNGLGLRQIIDWMMFTDKCLDDIAWKNDFEPLAEKVDIAVLAKTVTRMCQIYLGLRTDNITWCKDADEFVCEELMVYIMNSGDLGHSQSLFESGNITKIPLIKHPVELLSYLQKQGERNWLALNRHPYLKPFAWIYQTRRYIKSFIKNRINLHDIKIMYDEGAKRRTLFSRLGLVIKED